MNSHLDLEHYSNQKTIQIYGKERLWDKNQMEQVNGLLVCKNFIYLRLIYFIQNQWSGFIGKKRKWEKVNLASI